MILTAEISLYPLREEYEPEIIDFITRLRTYPDLDIQVHSTSTRVVGPYREVMQALTTEMERTYQSTGNRVFVVKYLNADLREDPVGI